MNSLELVKPEILNKASKLFSYSTYREYVTQLFNEGKSTGYVQNDTLYQATSMNQQRMNRIDKKFVVNDKLKQLVLGIDRPTTWLVISEGWCGDSAQNLPQINKLAELNKFIDLVIVVRDENPEIMDRYLTNGSKSIPKLIAFDAEGREMFTWGARPKNIQLLALQYKKEHPQDKSGFSKNVQVLYIKDKGKSFQEDFVELLS